MPRESDTIKVGDRAPEFTLPTQKGQLQSLAERRALGSVLLVFHRGTW